MWKMWQYYVHVPKGQDSTGVEQWLPLVWPSFHTVKKGKLRLIDEKKT